MQFIRDYMGDNSVEADAKQEEAKLIKAFPFLLQDGEEVVFAFLGRGGSGRDSTYFTSCRILIRDVKGLMGTSAKYTSIPYSTIKAYAVSTAGGGLDSDSELKVWASGMKKLEIEFSKDKVDLFELKRFLNSKLLPKEQECKVVIPSNVEPGAQFQLEVLPGSGQIITATCPPDSGPGETMLVTVPSTDAGTYSPGPKTEAGAVSGFLDWLGDDAHEVDGKEIEKRLKTSPHVLELDERVEIAYKSGRDHMVLTSKRLLLLDKRGLSGKKCVYLTVLWKSLRAFSVETAGSWDRDYELKLWTNIEGSLKCIEQDLRSGKANILAVQRFLSDKILGMDSKPPLPEEIDKLQGMEDPGAGLMALLGGDARQVDASEAERLFRFHTAILQGSESVDMALKGCRDFVLFTTKRLLFIDIQGWTGKKKEFLSVPWTTIKGFGVRSAGAFLDRDAEMIIYTDIMYENAPGDDKGLAALAPPGLHWFVKEDSKAGKAARGIAKTAVWVAMAAAEGDCDSSDSGESEPAPLAGMSVLELDLDKSSVDLMAVQRLLAMRCIPVKGQPPFVPVPESATVAAQQGSLGAFLDWLGDDNSQVSAASVQDQLESAQILIAGEKVAMAFKSGRDSFVMTNRRILRIDTQGLSGKRVEYTSVAYTSIRAFAVESAGTFDRDAEVKIYTRNKWDLATLKLDLRKGKADVLAIQSYLSSMVFGVYDTTSAQCNDEPPASFPQHVGGIEEFFSWIGDDAHQIDAAAVQERLRVETPILLPDEVVEAAFKCGRDMYVLTTKRMLFVDVQGWSGKKIEYLSVPWKYCTGFENKTAGKLDLDSEVRVYTDVPALGRQEQDLRKGKADVEQVWRMLQAKLNDKPVPSKPECPECHGKFGSKGCGFCQAC